MGYSAGVIVWYPDTGGRIYSTLYLKNTSDPLQLRTVRLFEKGVLFKSAPDLPVVFIRWEDVIKIEKSTAKPWQGVLKKWFDIPKDKKTIMKGKDVEVGKGEGQVVGDKK